MNATTEKQIEKEISKLRKIWKGSRTQEVRDTIQQLAEQLKGRIVAMHQCSSDSGIQYFTPDFVACLKRSSGLS